MVGKFVSPNKSYEAVQSVRGCGATTRDVVSIQVHRTGSALTGVESIVKFDGKILGPPRWEGKTLVVYYGSAKPMTMRSNYGEVQVVYKEDPTSRP